MDRYEALKLLRGGRKGIAEWNQWRVAKKPLPNLCGAVLNSENLSHADLCRISLEGAYLRHVTMHRTNLRAAILRKADLKGADFEDADLSGTDFSEANLEDSHMHNLIIDHAKFYYSFLPWSRINSSKITNSLFECSNLRHSDMSNCIIENVNFKNAQLISSNISYSKFKLSNLSEVDLSGANLQETELDRVNLSVANLANAKCDLTKFINTDLSNVKGLELVTHGGPSTLGTDTLILSMGKIPEAFLRGCGLPDAWIANLPALIGALDPIQFYSVFISYSSKDTGFAERLHADLQIKGVRCWYAPHDLPIGARIRVGIDEAIRVHDKLLLVLSKNSVASDWVEKEVETAMEQERQQKRTVLFPIRLDDGVMKAEVGWAGDIKRSRNIGDFRRWKDHDTYQKAFDRLLRDLKAEDSRA
jgi:uncharacterized protein YjbI with pentapeptide repeats